MATCWRTARWSEGLGAALLPVRLPLYRFRRALFHRARPAAGIGAGTGGCPAALPEFAAGFHPPFAAAAPPRTEVDGLEELFSDVREQLQGRYRLAGSRYGRVDIQQLSSFEDSEDHHAYHRLHWAVRYCRAAAFGYPAAGGAAVREIGRWLAADWENDPVSFWPYTLAERIASLAESIFWTEEISSLPVKPQIWKDAARLAGTVEYGLGVHNHLLNNARGLYIASAVLAECGEATAWRRQAFDLWDEYFPQLVLEDGTLAEQSSHYHLLLCRTALEYWLAAEACGRDLPAGFDCRLRRMFRLANDLLRPDGSLPRFGDNSPDHTVEDLWGLNAAAWHFGLLEEPPRHRAITPLTLYYCGAVPELPADTSRWQARAYPHGGFGMLRSADGQVEVVVHGDPRTDSAPHGDSGRGSFELLWKNEVLVREPGSFWAVEPKRRFYRTGKAQNVTCLNGLAPGIVREDRGYLPSWYGSQGGSWEVLSDSALEFRCDAYQRIRPDITLLRRWWFEGAGELVLEERIEGTGEVDFESRVCLGDIAWSGLEWDPAANTGRMIYGPVGMTVQAGARTTAAIEPCMFLPEYGTERAGRVLVLAARPRLPFTWRLRWNFGQGE